MEGGYMSDPKLLAVIREAFEGLPLKKTSYRAYGSYLEFGLNGTHRAATIGLLGDGKASPKQTDEMLDDVVLVTRRELERAEMEVALYRGLLEVIYCPLVEVPRYVGCAEPTAAIAKARLRRGV